MPNYLAIDVAKAELTVALFEETSVGLSLICSDVIGLDPNLVAEVAESGQPVVADEVLVLEEDPGSQIVDTKLAMARFLEGKEPPVGIHAIISSEPVLYFRSELPFNDSRKVDQVLPLQLQDELPIDIENFILDTRVLPGGSKGHYDILAAMIPRSELERTLTLLEILGVTPNSVSTQAAALSRLPGMIPEIGEDPCVILQLTGNCMSLCVTVDSKLIELREIPVDSQDDYPLLVSAIAASVYRAEQKCNCRFSVIHVSSSSRDFLSLLESNLGRALVPIIWDNPEGGSSKVPLEHLSWAYGLIASHYGFGRIAQNNAMPKVMAVRRGPYAFQPMLSVVMGGLRDDAVYFALCGFCVLMSIFSLLQREESRLEAVESAIAENVSQVITGEQAPRGGEISFIETKLSTLEERLRDLGSLSPLSPLDSLLEISAAIEPSLDISLSDITVMHSGMQLVGTASSIPEIGRLDGLLKERKKNFCEVNVDTKGRADGRVKFSADIVFCN